MEITVAKLCTQNFSELWHDYLNNYKNDCIKIKTLNKSTYVGNRNSIALRAVEYLEIDICIKQNSFRFLLALPILQVKINYVQYCY